MTVLKNLPALDDNQRNNSLTSYVGSLQARGLSDQDIRDMATQANQTFTPPMSQREVDSILKSILRKPKGIPY